MRTATAPRRILAATALVVATTLTGCTQLGAPTVPGQAATTDRAFQASLDGLVELGFPAALGTRTEPDGSRIDLAAGDANTATGAAAQPDEAVRIASNTKMFTATVVMQLVDEGAVGLDAPIETVLPGLVRGDGMDGNRITVRQLLQHTSGLPEYMATVLEADPMLQGYRSPRDLLDLALAQPAVAEPGDGWAYSNTNYLLLGLLIERLTGDPFETAVEERIIAPLGLESTTVPRAGERDIDGDHPRGYHPSPEGELVDATELDPSNAWAAGSMISTPSDVNRFMQALLAGELTSDESLAAMTTGVPVEEELTPGSTYGLGLQSYPLSCGGVAWGHGGDILGAQTRNAVDEDGRAVTIAVTALPWAFIDPTDEEALTEGYRSVFTALDDALCATA